MNADTIPTPPSLENASATGCKRSGLAGSSANPPGLPDGWSAILWQ